MRPSTLSVRMAAVYTSSSSMARNACTSSTDHSRTGFDVGAAVSCFAAVTADSALSCCLAAASFPAVALSRHAPSGSR